MTSFILPQTPDPDEVPVPLYLQPNMQYSFCGYFNGQVYSVWYDLIDLSYLVDMGCCIYLTGNKTQNDARDAAKQYIEGFGQ